jgi:hypothetical protein
MPAKGLFTERATPATVPREGSRKIEGRAEAGVGLGGMGRGEDHAESGLNGAATFWCAVPAEVRT